MGPIRPALNSGFRSMNRLGILPLLPGWDASRSQGHPPPPSSPPWGLPPVRRAPGARRVGRPQLRFKDVCKRDMKGAQINADTWEALAEDRDTWHHKVKEGVHSAEQTARNQLVSKGAARKERAASASTPSTFVCQECNKDCHSRIGLHSHSRRCALPPR